jgi:L-amino acid N-acyltransferase YncA
VSKISECAAFEFHVTELNLFKNLGFKFLGAFNKINDLANVYLKILVEVH